MTSPLRLKLLLALQVVIAIAAVGATVWTSQKIPKLLDEISGLEARRDVLQQEIYARQQEFNSDLETFAVERARYTEALQAAKDAFPDHPDSSEIERSARNLLEEVLPTTALQSTIAGLFAPTGAERRKAYDDLMAAYSDDPELPRELLNYAKAHEDNENGIYNTLVVLSHVDLDKLNADISEIESFAESVRDVGPNTATRVDILLSRLPD